MMDAKGPPEGSPLRLAGSPFAERRLRGGEPGDRHPERRARDIVEPDLVTERDRGGVAGMLAADADLELAAGGTPALDADPDELADAIAVDRHERIDRQNAAR